MDERFSEFANSLHPKYEALIRMPPVKMDGVPRDTPLGGVYLFSDGSKHMYVGRTKRRIRARLCGHVSTADCCPFAFRLAREATGRTEARYSGEHTRKRLLQNPVSDESTLPPNAALGEWWCDGFKSQTR